MSVPAVSLLADREESRFFVASRQGVVGRKYSQYLTLRVLRARHREEQPWNESCDTQAGSIAGPRDPI